MKTYSSKASICVQDAYHLEYRVCTISYFLNEEGGFRYVFSPNYSVIDLTSPDFFQGIPGLNLDLRKEEYVRENRTPTFISERVPQKNREDYADLLKDAGMTYMEPLLYLIKTDKFYSGDFLYLRPFAERKEVDADDLGSKLNTSSYLRKILCHLAAGDAVRIAHADKGRRFPFRITAAVPRVLHDDRRGLRDIVAAVFRRPASDHAEITEPIAHIVLGRARTEPMPGKPIAFARHIREQIAAFAEVGA